MKKIIIFLFILVSIYSSLFADRYTDLRKSLNDWEENGSSKATIARRLDVPYGTLYSFLTKEGATSPSVLAKYERYIKKQTPSKSVSPSKNKQSLKSQTLKLKIKTTSTALIKVQPPELLSTDPTKKAQKAIVETKQILRKPILTEKSIKTELVPDSSSKTMKLDASQLILAPKSSSLLPKKTQQIRTLPRPSGEKDKEEEGTLIVAPKYEEGYDSEEEDDWKYSPKEYPRTGRHKDHVLVPFFRGVHCFKDKFPEQERVKFLNDEQVGEGVFSTASFDILQLEYTEPKPSTQLVQYRQFPTEMKRAIRQKALEIQSKNIRRQVNKLKEGNSVIVDGIRFKNAKIGLHYLYVKSYTRFLQQLRDRTLLPEALKEFIAVANPIASAAELPDHAIRYAAGLKISGNVLRPKFDAQGKPKNPYLGKVYVILIPYEDIEESGLFRILEAYAMNEMPVNCRIINECEASFAGGISGKYIVNEHVIRVPNFMHEWKKNHEIKYGLTKTIYNNLRKEILATKGKVSRQEDVYEKLMQQIINRKYRQIPNDRTLSNQLLDIARNEAWLRDANLQFLDFRRLPTPTLPSVTEAKRIRAKKQLKVK